MLSLLCYFSILSLILVINEQKKWLFQHIFVLHDFKCGLYLTRMIITWRWWWSQCKVFSHAMKPVVSIGLRFYDTPERPAPKGWTINLILIFIIIINRVLDVRSYGESSVLRGFCLGRAGRVLWRALLDSWLGGWASFLLCSSLITSITPSIRVGEMCGCPNTGKRAN